MGAHALDVKPQRGRLQMDAGRPFVQRLPASSAIAEGDPPRTKFSRGVFPGELASSFLGPFWVQGLLLARPSAPLTAEQAETPKGTRAASRLYLAGKTRLCEHSSCAMRLIAFKPLGGEGLRRLESSLFMSIVQHMTSLAGSEHEKSDAQRAVESRACFRSLRQHLGALVRTGIGC